MKKFAAILVLFSVALTSFVACNTNDESTSADNSNAYSENLDEESVTGTESTDYVPTETSNHISAEDSTDDTSFVEESVVPTTPSEDITADDIKKPTVESQPESSNSNDSTAETTVERPDYVGVWEHTTHPHYVTVSEQNGNTIKLLIVAVRGEANSIADCEGTVTLVNGKGSFNFTDSFTNSGKCFIEIENDTMKLSFENSAPPQFWSVSVGAGSYKKVTDEN